MARSERFPLVRIARDLKLAVLLPPPGPRLRRIEASGVFARGRFFYIACDNMTAIGRVPCDLKSPGAWLPTGGKGPGYEDLTFSRRTKRFYLLVESERLSRGRWRRVGRIKLPKTLPFEDYAALAIRGNRMAVVSQASALLWVGRLKRNTWQVVDEGVVVDLPRHGSGKPRYCNVEGLSWLSANRLVAVSDRMKRGEQPNRCAATDEAIHIFELPRSRRGVRL